MTLRTDSGTPLPATVGIVPARARVRLPVLKTRARTENMQRTSGVERARQAAITSELLEGLGHIERPKTRGDCVGGQRPCPFVSCKYHLALEVHEHAIKYNFPHVDVTDMNETCSLDVADHQGTTLEEVSELLNITRERVRQIERAALKRVQKRAGPLRECSDNESLAARPSHGASGALHRNLRGPGRAKKEADEPEEEAEQELDLDWTPSSIWDLSQPETEQRAAAACHAIYRAYMDGSIKHGHQQVDAKFVKRLEAMERHVVREGVPARRPPVGYKANGRRAVVR